MEAGVESSSTYVGNMETVHGILEANETEPNFWASAATSVRLRSGGCMVKPGRAVNAWPPAFLLRLALESQDSVNVSAKLSVHEN